jgi:gas vesicle protein
MFFGGGAGFVLSFLESTKSVNVLTCALKTSISDCEEAEAEAVNAIDSVRKQKPYQKIQGTTDPAVEDVRKQIKNLTEIVTKQ